jgi:hypothetical protein
LLKLIGCREALFGGEAARTANGFSFGAAASQGGLGALDEEVALELGSVENKCKKLHGLGEGVVLT